MERLRQRRAEELVRMHEAGGPDGGPNRQELTRTKDLGLGSEEGMPATVPSPGTGTDPVAGAMERLAALDRLENLLTSATAPGALAEADLDAVAGLLGHDAAASLERLAELTRLLEGAGLIETREGRLELTPRGLRAVGRHALSDLFARLSKDKLGRHQIDHEGPGQERVHATKPYEYGDPFNLHIERTIRNAIGRCGGGTPVRLSPDDFEVDRTETFTRSSTVVCLDLSLSMPIATSFAPPRRSPWRCSR